MSGKESINDHTVTEIGKQRRKGKWTLLKEELKTIWKEFLTESSLHGCNCIPKPHKHWTRRFLWFTLVTVSAVYLMFSMVTFYTIYKTHPFITKTKVEKVKHMHFPAISICEDKYLEKNRNDTDVIEEFIISFMPIVKEFGSFNVTPVSYEEIIDALFDKIGFKIEDIVLAATVDGKEIDIKTEFMKTTSIYGHCFTFNKIKADGTGGNLTLSQGQSLSMILNVTQDQYYPPTDVAGTRLIFLEPRDEPTTMSTDLFVSPGFSTYISLIPTKMTFLPKPYTSYGKEDCVDVDTSAVDMMWHKHYSWSGCVEECVIKYAVSQCKCRPKIRGFPAVLSDEICTAEVTETCIYPHLTKVYDNILSQNDNICHCLHPCVFVQYDIRSSVMAFPSKPVADFLVKRGVVPSHQNLRDNYLTVNIKFDRMILQHVEHVPEIDSSTILSTLGGQMGFFLGASLLTLTEIAEAAFLSLLVLIKAAVKPSGVQAVGITR